MTKQIFMRIAMMLLICSIMSGCTLTERLGEGGSDAPSSNAGEQGGTAEPGYFGLAYYTGENVNPVLSVSQINRILSEALYEGLFMLDQSFTPQPVLCENYSGDGVNWTFTLKNGVKFWSGEPLTASDVVYSYELAMKTPESPYYLRMMQVQSVSAPSENTVQIILKAPNTSLLKLLDVPIFRKGTEANDFADGTGPYMPQSDGAKRWLVPFASWHQGMVDSFKRITLITTKRADAMVYSFETGDVSMTRADRISPTPATFKGTVEVYQTPTTTLHFLGVNYGHAPYHVGAVREAVSAAIDRERLCTTPLQSFADPAVLPVNPQPQPSETLQYSMTPDEEKAIALLASVGISDTNGDGVLDYPMGEGKRAMLAPVILVNSENSFKVAAAQQLVSDLERLGVRATLSTLPYEEYRVAITKGNYDFYYGETKMMPDFDVRPLMCQGGAVNISGYASTATDALIYKARAATGDARLAAQNELYRHLMLAQPVIPLAFTRNQVITRSGLMRGFSPAPYCLFYDVKNWKAV